MENNLETQIQKNLAEVMEIVSRAAIASGRTAEDITVLAISKRQPFEVIETAYQYGQRVFGESYVQEALPKIEHFSKYSDISWHMVGHIQSRKARQVAENFHAVHSLDSLRLAESLSQHRPMNMTPLEVYLEVNIGNEDTKVGFPTVSDKDWEALLPVVAKISKLERLQLVGLMGMPPLFADPQLSRPYFRRLRQLRDYLIDKVEGVSLNQLSAGTSADFEVAIEEGATIVRIGERLLGHRNYGN